MTCAGVTPWASQNSRTTSASTAELPVNEANNRRHTSAFGLIRNHRPSHDARTWLADRRAERGEVSCIAPSRSVSYLTPAARRRCVRAGDLAAHRGAVAQSDGRGAACRPRRARASTSRGRLSRLRNADRFRTIQLRPKDCARAGRQSRPIQDGADVDAAHTFRTRAGGSQARDDAMRRRDFIALAAGIMLARPSAAHAQRSDRVRRIAVLMSNAEDDPLGQERAAALRQGLRELGWSDGQNLRIEWRWSAGDAGRIRGYAAEVAELAPELIVANGTAKLSAEKQAVGAVS